MSVLLKNNAVGALSAGITMGDTTIDLGTYASAFPNPKDGEYFNLTIIDQNDPANLEIVRVNSRSGSLFGISRSQEGTAAQDWIADDIVELRLTDSIVQDIVKENDKRIYLDEIFICYMDGQPPTDATEMADHNLRNAPKLMNNWNSYWGSRVKCLIENSETGETWDDITFLTLADMYSWASTHWTLNGSSQCEQTLKVFPYETISQRIPVMSRMYGLNRFYSALRGKNNYTKGIATALRSADMEDCCASIINGVLGTSYTASTTNIKNTVWLTCARKNMYGIPRFRKKMDYRIDVTAGNGRCVSNAGSLSTANLGLYHNEEPDNVCYAYIPYNSVNCQILDTGAPSQREVSKQQRDGGSVLMCVGMAEAANSANKAAVVKPIGIDTLVIDYPDFSKYDLEFVYYNQNKQNHTCIRTFSTINDLLFSDNDPNKTKIRLSALDWIYTTNSEVASSGYMNQLSWDTIRFRLRDKVTGKIGELSYSGLVTENKKSIGCTRTLVRPMEGISI